MKKILKLEKRGCDFRENSEELKLSDLTNYRLCGYIKSNAKTPRERLGDYFIEICSNIQDLEKDGYIVEIVDNL